jgi:GxxExxY protein
MEWKEKIEELANEVMKNLGPFYTEKVYEEAFMHELRLNKIPYERQRNIEIIYKGYSIGTKKADCIINPGKRENEYLVEIKVDKNIGKQHKMQGEVYLLSLNIENGCILNFNTSNEKIELEEIKKPERKWGYEIALPGKKSKKGIKEILLESGKEVMDYLGTEFQYYKEPEEIYIKAVGVELRLKGINFHSVTYPVLYKGQKVDEYSYNYIFEDGSAALIFIYKDIKDIDEEAEILKMYNKIFGIKKGYILALPSNEKMDVEVRELDSMA